MRTSIFGRLLQRKVKSEMIIHFGRENYAVKRDTEATGRELHMLFRLPPNDDLFRVVGTKAIGNPIKDYEIVQLHEHDDFTAAPPHISGGAIGFPLAYTANRRANEAARWPIEAPIQADDVGMVSAVSVGSRLVGLMGLDGD